MVRLDIIRNIILVVVHFCLLGGVMFKNRPYFNLKIHDLYIITAKQLGAKRTNKKILKLVLDEMDFRSSDKSNRLQEILSLYFKHLPR